MGTPACTYLLELGSCVDVERCDSLAELATEEADLGDGQLAYELRRVAPHHGGLPIGLLQTSSKLGDQLVVRDASRTRVVECLLNVCTNLGCDLATPNGVCV